MESKDVEPTEVDAPIRGYILNLCARCADFDTSDGILTDHTIVASEALDETTWVRTTSNDVDRKRNIRQERETLGLIIDRL